MDLDSLLITINTVAKKFFIGFGILLFSAIIAFGLVFYIALVTSFINVFISLLLILLIPICYAIGNKIYNNIF